MRIDFVLCLKKTEIEVCLHLYAHKIVTNISKRILMMEANSVLKMRWVSCMFCNSLVTMLYLHIDKSPQKLWNHWWLFRQACTTFSNNDLHGTFWNHVNFNSARRNLSIAAFLEWMRFYFKGFLQVMVIYKNCWIPDVFIKHFYNQPFWQYFVFLDIMPTSHWFLFLALFVFSRYHRLFRTKIPFFDIF